MHHLTFLILFSQFIYCYGIAYSIRRVGFHLYNLLSTLQSTSIRIFLNAGSFFANLPTVSGVSSTLAHKIIYRVMASVESDYTAHVIFKVQKRFFECPFTYYSLETQKCCSLQKNPLTNKVSQKDFTNLILQYFAKNIYPHLCIRFYANLYCIVILIRFHANVKYFVRFNANLSVYIPCFW